MWRHASLPRPGDARGATHRMRGGQRLLPVVETEVERRPVSSSTMMSAVPPVFIAAMATDSALASINTRLRGSGHTEGKIRARRSAAIGIPRVCRATQDPHVPAGRDSGLFNRPAFGPIADDHERHLQSSVHSGFDECAHAFVLRQLSHEHGVSPGHRTWRRVGVSTNAGHIDPVGNRFDSRTTELGSTIA